MPLLKHAIKKMRQDERRKKINKEKRQVLKSVIRAASEKPTAENISKAYSTIDRAVKVNLIHKNTAGRKKSSLARLLKTEKKPVKKSPKPTTKK